MALLAKKKKKKEQVSIPKVPELTCNPHPSSEFRGRARGSSSALCSLLLSGHRLPEKSNLPPRQVPGLSAVLVPGPWKL